VDTNTIVQILGILVLILVPACGWLISAVISQGKELSAQEASNVVKFKSCENSCQECQKNFDRRINDNNKESDRRFSELTEWLRSIDTKLDKVLQKGKNE